MKNLVVDSQRMMENIDSQKGLVMAEKVMLVLVEQGMSRDDAHEILRSCSMKAIAENINLFDVCAENNKIINKIDLKKLREVFRPENHLGFSGSIVDLTVKRTREYLN
jgi:adenylosuccinate lyase